MIPLQNRLGTTQSNTAAVTVMIQHYDSNKNTKFIKMIHICIDSESHLEIKASKSNDISTSLPRTLIASPTDLQITFLAGCFAQKSVPHLFQNCSSCFADRGVLHLYNTGYALEENQYTCFTGTSFSAVSSLNLACRHDKLVGFQYALAQKIHVCTNVHPQPFQSTKYIGCC